MGTPHRGSGLASLGGILGALDGVVNLGGFGKSVRKGLVKDLKKNSKALTDISRSFIERAAYLRIVSFYEQLCLHGMTVLVGNASCSYSPYWLFLNTNFTLNN